MIRIYNTLGRNIQIFKPISPKKVKFYQCGPTVYWFQHLGNMRAMVLSDLIRKVLEYSGYEVQFVRNYTDFGHLVDGDTDRSESGKDKVQERVKLEGITLEELTSKYKNRFDEDLLLLNIKPASVSPKASEHVKEMKDLIQKLLDNGKAYNTGEVIYFDISKFDNYTELSGAKLDEELIGSGHGEAKDGAKRNPADFALWFFKTGTHKNSILTWESNFDSSKVKNGEGTPGWHIECSAMARKYLGDQLDIHMGGVEHIPIHHTNEIAQSESVTEKKYVNYWIHHEHLTIDGTKMSKSLGNVLYLSDIVEKGYDPMDLRYFFLQSHYRSKQNFTFKALDSAKSARIALAKKIASLGIQLNKNSEEKIKREAKRNNINDVYQLWKGIKKEIVESFYYDFNIPKALGLLWSGVDEIENMQKKSGVFFMSKYIDKIKDEIYELDEFVFSVKLKELADVLTKEKTETKGIEVSVNELPKEIIRLIEDRNKAKAEKNYDKSDEIRERLLTEHNIIMKDVKTNINPRGYILLKK